MIEVRNLTKHYGDKIAVNDISFTVEDGEILGFLGPNGAGKSTTNEYADGIYLFNFRYGAYQRDRYFRRSYKSKGKHRLSSGNTAPLY